MIDISNFKKRAGTCSEFKISRLSNRVDDPIGTINDYKVSEEIIVNSPEKSQPSELSAQNEANRNKSSPRSSLLLRIDSISSLLSLKTDFAQKISSSELNLEYELLKQKLSEIRIKQQQIRKEIRAIDEKRDNFSKQHDSSAKELKASIEKMTKNKLNELENLQTSKQKFKVFKDLSNLEILEVSVDPLRFVLQVKNDSSFIKFSLIHDKKSFEYCLLETSMNLANIPEAYSNNICFAESQFRIFYRGLMELIYISE